MKNFSFTLQNLCGTLRYAFRTSCFVHYKLYAAVFISIFITSSCNTIDLYEKTVAIPGNAWKSDFKPEFNFTIKDSIAEYQIFFIVRHTEKYNYNNIWINLYSQPPGDSLYKVPYEIALATDDKGWLGSGMNDIWEQRMALTEKVRLKAGNYKFIIEQIMREDPLENVLDAGLRVEKVQ